MTGIQTSDLGLPSHPVLYGTTLAISLAGSLAAFNPAGIELPFARVEAALGLAGSASAAVPAAPLPETKAPEALLAGRPAGEGPLASAADKTAPVMAARRLIAAPAVSRPALHIALLEAAKAGPPAGLQQDLKGAPQAASTPAIAAVQEPQRDQPAAAPTDPSAAAQPSPSFSEAFQTVPAPSLAAPPGPLVAAPVAETSALTKSVPALAAPEPAKVPASEPAAALMPPPAAAPSESVALSGAAPVAASIPEPATPALAVPAQPAVKPTAASVAPEPAPQAAAPAPAPAAQPLRLISAPQLRKFDLARIHDVPRTPPASLASASAKPNRAGQVRHAGAKDKLVDGVAFHRLTVSVAGSPARTLDVRIGSDMKPSIKVGELLALVSDRMDPASVARFSSAASAEEWVSLADLCTAGFGVAYNAGTDSISITAGE